MVLDRNTIAALIDHTCLKPNAITNDIERVCLDARRYGFHAVCVNPSYIKFAARLLAESTVRICTVVGFPLGAQTTASKVSETAEAIENGADELDMVMNIGWMKDGRYAELKAEIAEVVDIARTASLSSGKKKTIKIILETCYLTDTEKVSAATLAGQAGAHFVKTSTGFGSSGATVHDITLLRRVVGDTMGVKASGGIKTLDDAISMLDAGASRLGTSVSVQIVEAIL